MKQKLITLVLSLALMLVSIGSYAAIKEPDNIYYGQVAIQGSALTANDSDYTISVRYQDTQLDSFTMGQGNDNSDLYILRVPVDSVGVRTPGYVRTGDALEFLVSDSTGVVLTNSNIVYERGHILKLDLGAFDADLDTIDDATDNCVNTQNLDQADNDSDGVGNVCDAFPENPNEFSDLDGDGMGDNYENTYGFNPNDASDAGQDPDNDGKTNLEEFQSQDNPLVSNLVESVHVPMPLWAMVLAFICVLGLSYRGIAQQLVLTKNSSRQSLLLGLLAVGCLASPTDVVAYTTINQSITMTPGWNAVFLEVDPDDGDELTLEDRDPKNVFSSPEISIVWSLVNNENPSQFITAPDELGFNDPSWRVYIPQSRPEYILTNLFAVTPGKVYLVKVEGTQNVTLSVQGKPIYIDHKWQPNSYNFLGFYVDPVAPTNFADFLNLGTTTPIYQLSADGTQWEQIPQSTNIESGRGYWVYNDGSISQSNPINLSNTSLNGLIYPSSVSVKSFTFTNRSGSGDTNVTFQASNGFPLQYFNGYDTDGVTPKWDSANNYTTNALQGQQTSLLLGVDRTGMTQPTDALLTITGLGARIRLPLSAEPIASNTGLWAGVVLLDEVTNVNAADASVLEKTPAPMQFKLLLHVDSAQTVSLLKQVYLLGNENNNSLSMITSDSLLADFSTLSVTRREGVGYRLSSSAFDFSGDHLPLSGSLGNTLTATINIEPNLATHPMKHRYHRFHDDNDNSTGQTITAPDTFYDEVWSISRSINITTDQLFEPSPTDGMGRITGVYSEIISGLHKQDIEMRGRFMLQRINQISELNPTPN
ncbi:MAG: hypothetical protein MI867_10360 [Pseudomonadales bacterium]|nr:hypothetical protein [Pseudomonadales bacterium]